MIGEHVLVVFEVLAELPFRRIGEPRRESREHGVERQLIGCAGVAMRERHIARVPGLERKREPDDLRGHRIEARGLGVEADEIGALDRRHPALECRLVEHGLVMARDARRRIAGTLRLR